MIKTHTNYMKGALPVQRAEEWLHLVASLLPPAPDPQPADRGLRLQRLLPRPQPDTPQYHPGENRMES